MREYVCKKCGKIYESDFDMTGASCVAIDFSRISGVCGGGIIESFYKGDRSSVGPGHDPMDSNTLNKMDFRKELPKYGDMIIVFPAPEQMTFPYLNIYNGDLGWIEGDQYVVIQNFDPSDKFIMDCVVTFNDHVAYTAGKLASYMRDKKKKGDIR